MIWWHINITRAVVMFYEHFYSIFFYPWETSLGDLNIFNRKWRGQPLHKCPLYFEHISKCTVHVVLKVDVLITSVKFSLLRRNGYVNSFLFVCLFYCLKSCSFSSSTVQPTEKANCQKCCLANTTDPKYFTPSLVQQDPLQSGLRLFNHFTSLK